MSIEAQSVNCPENKMTMKIIGRKMHCSMIRTVRSSSCELGVCLLLGGSLGRGRAYVPGVMPACSYAYPTVDRERGICKNIAFATSLWREEMIFYRPVELK